MNNFLHEPNYKASKRRNFCVFMCLILGVTTLLAQQKIKGKITDQDGVPLPGATVKVKNNEIGTMSDFDGNYELMVPDNTAALVFSFVGFKTKEVSIDDMAEIDVSLEEDFGTLDEVVVVGFGTKKKAVLAGAVETISGEVFENRPLTNVSAGLQGVVPGLTVTRGDGQPGREGYSFRIRGLTSINNTNPLVLIDGLEGDINDINPLDIESISVLKDASASIYGARASNGVVLVTTKKGEKGKITVKVDTYTAIKEPTNLIQKLGLYEYLTLENEGYRLNGEAEPWDQSVFNQIGQDIIIEGAAWPNFKMDLSEGSTSDYIQKAYETGYQQNHNISISGGGEKSRFFVSAGYLSEDGIVKANYDDYERFNTRFNYIIDITDKLKLTMNTSIEKANQSENSELYSAISNLYKSFNFSPIRNPQGNYYTPGGFVNSIQMLNEAGETERKNFGLNTNFNIEYEIFDGFSLIAQLGSRYTNNQYSSILNTYSLYEWDDSETLRNNPNTFSKSTTTSRYNNYNLRADYSNVFGEKHEVSGTVGLVHEENDVEGIFAQEKDLPTNDFFALGLGDPELNSTGPSGDQHWSLQSVISRLGYIYDNKYIIEGIMRYDGSSRFNPEGRWGLFPGITSAWRVSEESFMENVGFIDELKLKASWGESGNQSGIGLYDYQSRINIGGVYPFGNEEQAQIARPAGLISLSRTWETVATSNLGLELNMFDSRFNLGFDYFVRRNQDMLIPVQYPAVLGGTPPPTNNGELETKGWELKLSWNDRIGDDFEYYISGQLSDNKNELVKFDGREGLSDGYNFTVVGYPVNSYFGLSFDGIIQNQQELDEYKAKDGVWNSVSIGDARYRDINNDGVIDDPNNPDSDKDDVVFLGDTNPRYNYGINLGGSYKAIDIGIILQGVGKRTLFRSGDFAMPWRYPWHQPIQYFWGRTWSPERPNAKFPVVLPGPNNVENPRKFWNYRASENTRINGAYLRVKNVQLGYTIPDTATKKIGIQKARIYGSAQDILTFSSVKESGFDPEAGQGTNYYPFSKTYSFGIQLTF